MEVCTNLLIYMTNNPTSIRVDEQTKEELAKFKLCPDESYDSLLKRVLPTWATTLNELNKKEKDSPTKKNPSLTKIDETNN